MDSNSEYLLSLINCAVHGRKAEKPNFPSIDWEKLHNEAAAHNLLAVVYPAVDSLVGECRPPKDFLDLWRAETISLGAAQLNKNLSLSHLLTEAKKRGIKIIVVKGVVLGQLYPDYLLRVSGDADLLIDPKDKEKAEEMMNDLGYELDQEESIDCEQTYHLGEVLTVELHTRLWEETEGKRLELLESIQLVEKESLLFIDACDMQLWTLGYTQHLIYLIYHMVKHFFVCGIGIRHLTDLSLYINTYYNQIDFPTVWKHMDQLGYVSFCENIFGICIRYFDMMQEVLPVTSSEEDTELWMLKDIIDAGVFGGKTNARWKSGRIMRMYYENEIMVVPKSKLRLLIQFLFPKSEELSNQRIDKVTYSKILPIAWVQRGFFFFKRWKKDSGRCAFHKRIECAAQRILLLRKLNLLK